MKKHASTLHLYGLLVLNLFAAQQAHADFDWLSATLDNDIFVGNDNGYSNGLYISLFDVNEGEEQAVDTDILVRPLLWSLPKSTALATINAYTVGQTLNTPSDITIEIPDENELPYSALLALTNTYVVVNENVADRISTTVGFVGPVALGGPTQRFVHKLIGSDEPLGWDTQLENELVFQFGRGRTWRSWSSKNDSVDILTHSELSVGTIQSAVRGGLTFRFGRGLKQSYATTSFGSTRTSNPAAVEGGWYVFAGLQTGYVFNQIFTDGNTFRDSRSIDFDKEFVSVAAGLAYSWENVSVTFAINDSNVIQRGETEEALEDLTQYGTLTVAFRL